MTDAPRTIISYAGAQIQDARGHIRVVFAAEPKRGVRWCLKDAGFDQRRDGAWERRASPQAIFSARSVLNEFYGEPDAQ